MSDNETLLSHWNNAVWAWRMNRHEWPSQHLWRASAGFQFESPERVAGGR